MSGIAIQVTKALRCLRWLPAYGWQRLVRRPPHVRPVHLVIAIADHFEPSIVPDNPETYALMDVQERRLERWCSEYPKVVEFWRDADGRPLQHTYFYPAEQYNKALIDRLAEQICLPSWQGVIPCQTFCHTVLKSLCIAP